MLRLLWPCDEKRKTTSTTATMIEEKRSSRKQREKMLAGLTKWLRVGRLTEELKATRDRDAGQVMIACT